MANGRWHGSKEQWDSIEAQLCEVDPVIAQFTSGLRLPFSKNQKDWPERSISWGSDIRCLIQLYLLDPDRVSWNLWICCSQDRSGGRFWKREFLIRDKRLEEFKHSMSELLAVAREHLIAWSERPDELEFATKLTQPS